MSTYHPDRWTIVEITAGEEVTRKVFSGSYGGYTGSDTWKLSSVIESIKEDAEGYEVLCMSGSVYMLHKQAYGMSGYMSSIYESWITACEQPESTLTIRVESAYDHRK